MAALTEQVQKRFPSFITEVSDLQGTPLVRVQREGWSSVAAALKNDPEFRFDLLMDLFGVDYLHWEEKALRFEVTVNLYSTLTRQRLFVKISVPEKDPVLDSVSGLWPAADWYEREAWDMFGISFKGHPNLKRILMYEDFKGHPLRKDYAYNKRQPLIGPMVCLLLMLLSVMPAQAAEKGKVPQGDWQALFNQGVDFGRDGDWDKAIENLSAAANIQPGRAEIYTNLCLAHTEKKDYVNAIANGEKAVQADPKRPASYLALGLAHEGLGNVEEAIKTYKQGIQADPKSSDLHLTLGNLYGKQGAYDDAIASYEQALQADEANVFVYSNLAYIYEERGDTARAMKYLEKATQAEPSDPVAWYDLGAAYAKQGDKAKALECYDKSYQLDPASYKACLSLALAHEDRGDLEKASEYYVKAMSLTDDAKLKEAILRQVSRSGQQN